MRFLILLVVFLACGYSQADTVVTLGMVRQFTGPDDPNLDLVGAFDYAVNFSLDDPVRTVKGLTFKPDTQSIPGASFLGPQNVVSWQAKPEFGNTADANALEEIMHDIRWAVGASEKLQATLAVTPGIPYKLQVLISGNNPETRRWDIRFNGQPAVDEISSLGINPGATYANNRSTVWTHEFTPTSSPIIVEMGNFFGGNDGGDRNPIWQALTLERVYIPPTPEELTLAPTQFFAAQTASVGSFAVTDGKFGVSHVLSFVNGAGAGDNAKFTISGTQLLPAPFNFSAQPAGTTYALRVRATDAEDAARFLEKTFTVSLVGPHAPSAVSLDASSMSSGLLAGQFAGRLLATDPDSFDRHVFQLVAGVGSAQNNFFTVMGNELRVVTPLPVGTATVSLRVRATDLSGLNVETVLSLLVLDPQVRINEVLTVSTSASLPLDQEGNTQDWIELYNELDQPVSMAGWHLSDNAESPNKWTFPEVVIPSHGYFLIFASGSGATPTSGPPHTNFSLSQQGERLILSRPNGSISGEINLPEQFPNATWGVGNGGVETGYLRTPTPSAVNSLLAPQGRVEVFFDVPHGHKIAAFPLTLSTTLGDAVIHYTLDGSVPTAASPVYATPLMITPIAGTNQSGVRIVRAVVTHPDAAYTPVTTQTYLFVNGIANPRTDGVVGQANLYGSITNHATYGPLIESALLSLPAVSLVINNATDLPYVETESSMELFDPQDGEPGFTIPTGIARTGTTSLTYPKGSMSARFRGSYGASKLSYPIYGRHPYDRLGAATEFQELRLRSGSHDTHAWLGTAENPPVPYGYPSVLRSGDAQYVRNIWIEDLQLLMGQPGKHGRMVQMFVNGNYYGIYHLQEHADDDYMGTYFPGGTSDYHYTGGATTGSTHGTETWSSVWSQLKASLGDYTQAKRWVDVTNLADYMILSFYAGNDWDWSGQHNWGAAGPRLPDWGGWKFFSQDQDLCLQDVNADCTDQSVPDGVFGSLMAFADFKTLFRDRVYKHFFHDGVLTPTKAASAYALRTNEINSAVIAETARWQPTSSVGPLPWDRDGEWTVERNYLMNTYFPQRTNVQLNQFRLRGWYPLDAPEMSQWGGAVAPGMQLTLTGPSASSIYYTLDGSDPRLPGGAVSPTAMLYHATAITRLLVEPYNRITSKGAIWKYLVSPTDPGTTWKNNAYNDSSWPQGKVSIGAVNPYIVTQITRVDTDPIKPGFQGNLTTYFRHSFTVADAGTISSLNLRVKRDDGAVVYLNGQEIFRTGMQAGVIGFTTPGNNGVADPDDGISWFVSPTLTTGQFTLNEGVNVLAVELHNATISDLDLTFDLELTATVAPSQIAFNAATTLKTRALNGTGTEWSPVNVASFYLTGTQPAATANLTPTEIHYHPEGINQGDAEFIEFKNTSSNPVDLTGVKIGSAVVYTFPAGLVLLPGEYVVVVKSLTLFDARYRTVSSPYYHAGIRVAGSWAGSLANSGESIVVVAADNTPIYTFAYDDKGAWPGRADGSGSSLELANPSAAPPTLPEKALFLGSAESWRPSSEFHGTPGYAGSGPDNRVVINEVLAASIAPSTDFIELLNISGLDQSLGGWFLSDNSANFRKFKIPAATSLAPGAYLVFDESHFNNPANPNALVPFALNSDGDDVFLLQADPDGNLLKFADRAEFSAVPPGFTLGRSPNGTGNTVLLRSPSAGSANTAAFPEYAAWLATAFSPNTPSVDLALSADPDHDGLNNLLEFAFKLSPSHPNGSPLTAQRPTSGGLIQVEYTLRNDFPGMTARVDVSNDLQTWDLTGDRVEMVSQVPHPDGTTTYTARIKPLPAALRTFMRITIGL